MSTSVEWGTIVTLVHANDLDIDVDIAPLLGTLAGPTWVDSRYYELAAFREGRPPALQRKAEQNLHNALLQAQWRALRLRRRERRRAVRAPLLARVRVDNGPDMTACNISLSGMCCSGRPCSGILQIEVRLPGEPFPVDARAELVRQSGTPLLPLVGLRFVSIERPYVDQIRRYVHRRLGLSHPDLRAAA